MKKTIAVVTMTVAALWSLGAGADAFRCGTRLVTDGDSTDKVEALCGPPTSIQRHDILRQPVQWIHGRPYNMSSYPVEIPVEYWTYNLGPNKLMRRLTFEDGLLVEVETLSHGYYSDSDD